MAGPDRVSRLLAGASAKQHSRLVGNYTMNFLNHSKFNARTPDKNGFSLFRHRQILRHHLSQKKTILFIALEFVQKKLLPFRALCTIDNVENHTGNLNKAPATKSCDSILTDTEAPNRGSGRPHCLNCGRVIPGRQDKGAGFRGLRNSICIPTFLTLLHVRPLKVEARFFHNVRHYSTRHPHCSTAPPCPLMGWMKIFNYIPFERSVQSLAGGPDGNFHKYFRSLARAVKVPTNCLL